MIKVIRVTTRGEVRTLNGDASLSCNADHIVIHVHYPSAIYVFPISASIQKVFMENGVTAVFPPLQPDADMRRHIRDGSVILLKTL